MAEIPQHHREEWTNALIRKLRELAGNNTPTRVIALKLGRTPGAIQTRASEEDISLKPTNQSPYNRRRK
ncbi:hypothetical protein EPN90_01845 [Patescibacteria group bacterium]|nr:MAG: hypothetical protein EPN90_01845 [Patescibacteria group bacterium]